MALEPLPPIPTPLRQRWREFRIQVLPVLFFILVVAALVVVWRSYLHPTNMIGEVEAIRANATSLLDGTLAELTVDRFHRVTKGQVIGRVETAIPGLLEASLAAMAADLKLLKVQIDLDRTRNLDAYARMRLSLLTEKVALNLAKIRQTQVENEYDRIKTLHDAEIIPGGLGIGVSPSGRDVYGYDVALRGRDSVRAEVADREFLVLELEKDLKRMEATSGSAQPDNDSLIEEALAAKEQELQRTLAPVVDLVAPLDGIVSMVYRRTGERIVRGEPILTISSPDAQRIIGYVRAPVGKIPAVEDVVVVRTRGMRPLTGEAKVLEVGPQLEPLNPALISTDSNWVEMGLPVLISMPESLRTQLRPGQVLDLNVKIGSGKG